MKNNLTDLQDMNVFSICDQIINEGIFMQEISIEYRESSHAILTRAAGIPTSTLSSEFTDRIQMQLQKLRNEVIFPLINATESNFTLKVKVDKQGVFDFDNLNITFKLECKKSKSVTITFNKPFTVLMPFAEYVSTISIQGHNYNVSLVIGEINLGLEDLVDAIEIPIVGPRVKENWNYFAYEAYQDAKNIYKLDVKIPCFEGEMQYKTPNKLIRMQHLEYVAEGRRG